MQTGALILKRLDEIIPAINREWCMSYQLARQANFIGTDFVFS